MGYTTKVPPDSFHRTPFFLLITVLDSAEKLPLLLGAVLHL
jgi:hypothetical protein